MTNIINLNKKRKAVAKVEKEKTASSNRIKFGQTKAQKQTQKMQSEQIEKNLENHKLDK